MRHAHGIATQRDRVVTPPAGPTLGREPGGPVMFTISTLTSIFDLRPRRETVSWQDLITLFSKPQRALCTRQTCSRGSCPHRRGACWSPTSFTGTPPGRGVAETTALLVFDIDHQPDDQIDEIRNRIGALQYLMHSTHSDRPDSRCLRIIFPLSRPIAPSTWKTFWPVARQGLVPIADAACADVKRFYFLPSSPSDASYFLQTNGGEPLNADQHRLWSSLPHDPRRAPPLNDM